MTFSNLGFYYLIPGQSIDVEIWWGQGEDHGAVLAMARFHAQTSGPLPIGTPSPTWQFATSNARSNMHFTFEAIGDSTETFSYPWQSYTFTVTNTGADDGYFSLDGMTTI